jgi:transposase InsO family protein
MPTRERTIMDIREEMARMAADDRFTVTEVALRYGVTRPTVRLWRARYREGGRRGLIDLSHAPLTCPHRTTEAVEHLILAERTKYPLWGSKKILRRLRDAHPDLELPGRSAVDALLSRRGLVQKRRRRNQVASPPFRSRYTASEPSELTTIDHKGQFRMLNGKYCYPLTIVDSVSRYLLACTALTSTSLSEAWPVIEQVFREHGLPVAMQSDNGPPFGSPNGSFSTMSVRLMQLSVLPVFSRPAHPQDNGRHERMHFDLKAATTRPPASTTAAQQKKFNEFIECYNFERPHEGIDMQRPASVFQSSPRPFPRYQRKPQYAAHFETRKVSESGNIKWQNHGIFIAHPFRGQTLGIEPTDDGICTVHFYGFIIGKIDERTRDFI